MFAGENAPGSQRYKHRGHEVTRSRGASFVLSPVARACLGRDELFFCAVLCFGKVFGMEFRACLVRADVQKNRSEKARVMSILATGGK